MAKRVPLDEKLARLRALEDDPASEEALSLLRTTLRGKDNVLAARAAEIVGKHGLEAMIEELAAAFTRFMKNGEKADKGCRAKLAIVDALAKLEAPTDEVFLAGVRYVQQEPVWGKPEDTAANLRGNCGQALVLSGCSGIHLILAELVMDPEVEARRGAIRALTQLGGEASEAMLRMKALAGDKNPEVTGACLSALVELGAARSLDFVARFLNDEDAVVVEDAALALGESRSEEAFGSLRECWRTSFDNELKGMLLVPMALTRCEEAFSFLMEVVEEHKNTLAADAVEALRVFAGDEERASAIREAVERRDDVQVHAAYARAFGE